MRATTKRAARTQLCSKTKLSEEAHSPSNLNFEYCTEVKEDSMMRSYLCTAGCKR